MSKDLQGNLVYHVFSLLWNTQFIIGFNVCVVAHVSSRYYGWLVRMEGSQPDAELPKWPLCRAGMVVAWCAPALSAAT